MTNPVDEAREVMVNAVMGDGPFSRQVDEFEQAIVDRERSRRLADGDADAEAERRYVQHATDFDGWYKAKRAAFVAGAEWALRAALPPTEGVPACATCDDSGNVTFEWGPAQPCPDCASPTSSEGR